MEKIRSGSSRCVEHGLAVVVRPCEIGLSKYSKRIFFSNQQYLALRIPLYSQPPSCDTTLPSPASTQLFHTQEIRIFSDQRSFQRQPSSRVR